MQSAIAQKVTGQTVLEFLRPRLFEPLGDRAPGLGYELQGISLGGYGLRVRTEDIAKFGQLYLQRGRWNGKQLLPAEWVAMATAKQTSNGSNSEKRLESGLRFPIWRCRHNAFRGDGAFGQYCLVLPDQDAVVVITGGVKDMQAVLNVIWGQAAPRDATAGVGRQHRCQPATQGQAGASRSPQCSGAATSSLAGKILDRKFVFPANDQKIENLALSSSDPERPRRSRSGWTART